MSTMDEKREKGVQLTILEGPAGGYRPGGKKSDRGGKGESVWGGRLYV